MVICRLMLVSWVLVGTGCATLSSSLTTELAECSKTLSTPQVPAQLMFENGTESDVEVHWVQVSSGKLVRYEVLGPGAAHSQSTYVGHLWAIHAKRGGFIGSHCAGEGQTAISIKPESLSVTLSQQKAN